MAADPRNTGRVSKMSFRKVLYFAGGLSYPTVNVEVNTVSAPSGFIDYLDWMRQYLVGPTDKQRMTPGIADDARPEAEVVEEVRQMVCDNFDDVIEAFRSLDPQNKGTLSFDEFTRAVLLGLRMTRMTAHHRTAIFHHAKKINGTDDVDYVDWIQLFAPAHLQQREIGRRQAPTLRSTTPRGTVPGQGVESNSAGITDNSVAQLIAQLKTLKPSEAVACVENLNLSNQARREIFAVLSQEASANSANGEAPTSPETEDYLMKEVLNLPISPKEKMQRIKELPISADKRVEALELLGREDFARLKMQQ